LSLVTAFIRSEEEKPMFCTQCGAARGEKDHYCAQCGARVDGVALPESAVVAADSVVKEAAIALGEPPASSVAQVRPWVRYWARMLDIYLFCVALAVLSAVNDFELFEAPGREQVASLVAVLGWAFTEAGLLAAFGTTPGKALLRVRLVPPPHEGDRVPYGMALTRSLRVWWRGLGAGIPLVSLFTLLAAHSRLKSRGVSSWDIDGGWRVEHGRVGAWRALVAVLIFGAMLGLVVVGSVGM
jgi:hypothetical protein